MLGIKKLSLDKNFRSYMLTILWEENSIFYRHELVKVEDSLLPVSVGRFGGGAETEAFVGLSKLDVEEGHQGLDEIVATDLKNMYVKIDIMIQQAKDVQTHVSGYVQRGCGLLIVCWSPLVNCQTALAARTSLFGLTLGSSLLVIAVPIKRWQHYENNTIKTWFLFACRRDGWVLFSILEQ